ncbi:hypothetical protein [Ferruginibacter sp.]
MKNKRLFGIVNTVNIALWIAFMINRLWDFFGIAYVSFEQDWSVFIFFGITLIIVFSFSFFCYKLIKALKYGLPLSDSSRLIGPIFAVIVTLFTIFLIWLSIDQIKNYFTYRFPALNRGIVTDLIIMAICITSSYLCIAYWVIRNQVKKQLTGIIADLGKNENS